MGAPYSDWRSVANDSTPLFRSLQGLQDRERRKVAVHVGAGPSLDAAGFQLKGIDTERGAIFAVDGAFAWMAENLEGLSPDYVVTSEEGEGGSSFFSGFDTKGPKGLICAHTAHPSVKNAWAAGGGVIWQYVNWLDRSSVRDRWDGVIPSPGLPRLEPVVQNVLWQSIAAADYLGFDLHLLIGADMGFDSRGPTHCSEFRAPPWDRQRTLERLSIARRDADQLLKTPKWIRLRSTIADCTVRGRLTSLRKITFEEALVATRISTNPRV